MRNAAVFSILGVAFGACNGPSVDTEEPAVLRGPDMAWVERPEGLAEGQPVTLTVDATDEDGVAQVVAYYRTQGDRTWTTAPEMTADADLWAVDLAGDQVAAPALEVYFKADDQVGAVSYLPAAGPQEPFVVDVARIGLPLPYTQGFEDNGDQDLSQLGWRNRSLAFEGYDWALSTARSSSGLVSVSHRRAPSTIGGDIDDLLVSPVLDLSTVGFAQVTWWETGINTELADHALWLSTGSPDPADGEFVEVTDLVPPREGTWSRARAVDLSEWAGESSVTLAWAYRGIAADSWWIDDVAVEALGPDLQTESIAWTPDPLEPGDAGTLLLSVGNASTVAASGVDVTVHADAYVEFPESVSVGAVAGEGAVDVEVPLTVLPDAPDNVWVNLTLEFTDGERTWEDRQRMLVGQPSVARVAYDLEPAGEGDPAQLVRVFMGVGDPDAPTVEFTLDNSARTAGTYEVERDITEYYDYLPALPGDSRWWVRFESGPRGSLTDFQIEFGGEVSSSTDVGPLASIAPTIFWLPEPPAPALFSQTTSPSPVGPGDVVSWSPTFVNRGAATFGVTTVQVRSIDPSITLTDSGPFDLSGPGGLDRNRTATATFGFTVAEDRKSSLPARFIATITDDYESFMVPVDVAIPYPVLSVSGVVIDDWDDGDDDGLLDPDEQVRLDISLTNVGGLGTDGAVSCVLGQVGGSAAVELSVDDGFFGVLSAGSSFSQNDFTVAVTEGTSGDDLQFELVCSDRSETYIVPFEIVLGERPWIAMTPLPDAVGDNRDDYRFDIRDGQYRSDGTTLEIRLRSVEPYGGLAGLFIEGWASSSGGEYTFYNVVANGAVGSVRGYRGRFTPLADVDVTEVDDYRILLSVPLEPLGLRVDQLSIGMAAGFCGGDSQYCDHYPDGWGTPYSGLFTSRWTTLRW